MASNETAADNRSAVEIWRDFIKSIKLEMETSKNENVNEFMIYASRFESTVKQYFIITITLL